MARRRTLSDAYMLISDLCNSTSIGWRDHDRGLRFHERHEALCLQVCGLTPDSKRYKAMGDGAMIEFSSARDACKAALMLQAKAVQVRRHRGFSNFHLKITVSHGAFLRSPKTQRWIGVLPTKASRISLFAREDEVWIDDVTLLGVKPHLRFLAAAAEDVAREEKAAAFRVLLKGFGGSHFTIHQLRRSGWTRKLSADELKKEWHLLWTDVEMWVKQLTKRLEKERFSPRWIVGIGRSGAILGGMIAGNLAFKIGDDHVPVSVIERTHGRHSYVLCSITEAKERYNNEGNLLDGSTRRGGKPWALGPVLVVLGEAKTGGSMKSARTWLKRRGFNNAAIRTAALVASTRVNYCYVRGDSALLPWQLVPGYDRDWATYRRT